MDEQGQSISVRIIREKERAWFVQCVDCKFWLPKALTRVIRTDGDGMYVNIPTWLWQRKSQEMEAQRRKFLEAHS